MKTIRIKAPATSANFVCGFDIIGFAVESPGDEVELRFNAAKTIRITEITGSDSLSSNANENCAAYVLQLFCQKINTRQGLDIRLHKGVPIGSGLGSSAAGSMGVLYAANILFDSPLTDMELVSLAMQGEAFISGALHADNVAPCLLGGITLIPVQDPLQIISCPVPPDLGFVIALPDFELPTKEARKVLPETIALKTAVKQWGNVAGLVASLFRKDTEQLAMFLRDHIIEPARAALIPGFYQVQRAALEAGAFSCSISGGGPSLVAMTRHPSASGEIADAMKNAFTGAGLSCRCYVTRISKKGCERVDT
ncbi:homoserine kinase [candidate division KSB1 bacterium]|nr:homoserine kinase [candidate division KSB1 bacterium]